jgi:hypothetical protein
MHCESVAHGGLVVANLKAGSSIRPVEQPLVMSMTLASMMSVLWRSESPRGSP